LTRIGRQDGDDVKVGEVLGVIEESAAGAAASGAPEPPPAQEPKETEKTRATPTAQKDGGEHDVDLSRVRGTGDAGRVMRRDVEQAAAGSGNTKGDSAPAALPATATRTHEQH